MSDYGHNEASQFLDALLEVASKQEKVGTVYRIPVNAVLEFTSYVERLEAEVERLGRVIEADCFKNRGSLRNAHADRKVRNE